MDERRTLAETVQELQVAAEALAALGAWLRVAREGIPIDPTVATHLDRVRALLVPASVATDPQADAIAGVVHAFLRHAADLVDDPGRVPGWVGTDQALVDAQGRASSVVPSILLDLAPPLEGLADRFAAPGARFLDVGTGVGKLAIAMASVFPAVSVVGIDAWAEVLEHARVNVVREGMTARVQLHHADVTTFRDPLGFDAAWLPGPFLATLTAPFAVAGVGRNLRPGGWALFGRYQGEGALSAALADLRTVRSGAHPWSAAEVVAMFEREGFVDAHEIPRTWPYPLGLVAARRP